MEGGRNDGKMPAWFEGHRGCLVKDHKMIWERIWGLELMGLHHQLQVEELDLNFHWMNINRVAGLGRRTLSQVEEPD